MPAWRIYYDDGSFFDASMGTPKEAPPLGFVCAVGWDESGDRYIMHGWDHYCWDIDAQQWWGMDLPGLFDRLIRNLVFAYKQGRTVMKSDFQRIMRKAHEDPDFPQHRGD